MLKIFFSDHAKRRARERGITLASARLVILNPDLTLPAYDNLHRYRKLVKGKTIEVVISEQKNKLVVVTLYYLS